MATSGVTNTQLTRDSIIAGALRKLGVLAKGESPDSEDLSTGTEALNNLLAQFQTLGMPLWSRITSNITMVAGQQTYTIGVGQSINQAFPLKIIQAWTEPTAGGARQPIVEMSIYDFNILPSSTQASGTPAQFSYQPFINYGQLKLWPAPDTSAASSRTLTISYMRPFDEFVSSTDTPYFPKEWNNALIYGLASLLAPEFQIPLNDRSVLKKEAEEHLNIALDFGLENASITFAPEEHWG